MTPDMEEVVERLEGVLSAQGRGLIRHPQSADLRALLSERRKMVEALECVREHFNHERRDKDWLETERLVRAALTGSREQEADNG